MKFRIFVTFFAGAFAIGNLPGALGVNDMNDGFVDVTQAVPTIIVEPRYAGHDNFTGSPITGYNAAKVIVSKQVAEALSKVQQELNSTNLSLKIYDGYRPQRAVDHFMGWINNPSDQKAKDQYYPNIKKSELVALGYIAEKSGHSRGGSVDVSLVRRNGNEALDLDMGSSWDLFDPISHANAKDISAQALQNRQLLREIMIRHGFKPYSEEWWHFTLEPEPYPDTYFDFPID